MLRRLELWFDSSHQHYFQIQSFFSKKYKIRYINQDICKYMIQTINHFSFYKTLQQYSKEYIFKIFYFHCLTFINLLKISIYTIFLSDIYMVKCTKWEIFISFHFNLSSHNITSTTLEESSYNNVLFSCCTILRVYLIYF